MTHLLYLPDDATVNTPHALKGGGFLGHARLNRPRYFPTGLTIPV